MSLLGAAALGVSLGNLVADATFNYTKQQYLDKISDLEALSARLEKHIMNMENLKTELGPIWDDENGRKMIKNLDQTIAITKIQANYANAMLKTFKETVAEMDSSQSALGAVLDVANMILGAFKA